MASSTLAGQAPQRKTGEDVVLPRSDAKITVQEKRWIWGFVLLVLSITSLPYVLGFMRQTPEWVFTGFVFGVEDGNSYIAKMLSGGTGDWLFRTPYSAYPQPGVLIQMIYILAGKLAAPFGGHTAYVMVFHLLRLVGSAAAIWATYYFLAQFVQRVGLRRLGLALAVLGGGWGWILLLARGTPDDILQMPVEFYSPEAFGFLGIYGIPHLALLRAFLMWGLVAYLQTIRTAQSGRVPIRHSLGVGGLWLAAGVAQGLLGMVVGVVVGLHLLALAVVQLVGRSPWPEQGWRVWRRCVGVAFVAGLVVLPLLVHIFVIFTFDPFFKVYTAQNPLPSAAPIHYVWAYGALLLLAVFGAPRLLRRLPVEGWLPLAWVLALPLLVYAPVGVQRRLVEGGWVALIVLALAAADGLQTRPEPGAQAVHSGWQRWALAPLALNFVSTCLLILGALASVSQPKLPLFRPADEVLVFETVRQLAAKGTPVLASFDTGNALPAWAPVKVIIGLGPESVNWPELQPKVEAFYTAGTPDAARLDLLGEFDMGYVIWGPNEHQLGDWDPHRAVFLQQVAQHGDWYLFEVLSEGR